MSAFGPSATQGEQNAVRKACDAEVLEYQRRMEDMQVQFTQMLRETLDKVGRSTGWVRATRWVVAGGIAKVGCGGC